MKIGPLRHRVNLQSPTLTRDNFGEVIETSWNSFGEVWAEVRALSGKELWNAQQSQPHVTHSVVMRFRSDVSEVHRLTWDSRVFNIDSIIPDTKRSMMTLTCIENKSTPQTIDLVMSGGASLGGASA